MRPHVLAALALAPLDAAFVTWFGARSGEDICDLVTRRWPRSNAKCRLSARTDQFGVLAHFGRRTTVSQNSSMVRTTVMNWSRSTGLDLSVPLASSARDSIGLPYCDQ
jgi:hypothetical protein